MQAVTAIRGKAEIVVVFYADMPLLRAESLQRLIDAHMHNRGPVALLSVMAPDPRGFGRIGRNGEGQVVAIVEEADATPEQRLIRELNVGVYAFAADWVWDQLPKLTPKGSKSELYLTDMVEFATAQRVPVLGLESDDLDEMIGVNTRGH